MADKNQKESDAEAIARYEALIEKRKARAVARAQKPVRKTLKAARKAARTCAGTMMALETAHERWQALKARAEREVASVREAVDTLNAEAERLGVERRYDAKMLTEEEREKLAERKEKYKAKRAEKRAEAEGEKEYEEAEAEDEDETA